MKIRIVGLFVFLFVFGNLNAQDFTVDGINYTIKSTTNLTVEIAASSCYNGDLNLQSTVTNNGTTYTVTSIEPYAFSSCNSLKAITLPNTITIISDGAFNYTGLVTVTLPNTITSINFRAFERCEELETINFPEGITSIGERAFENCEKLSNITLPSTLTDIGEKAFYRNLALNSITIPEGVSILRNEAFDRCENLSTVTLPNTLSIIEDDVFGGSYALQSISFPQSLTSIGERAFQGSGLTSIIIPASVSIIKSSAFSQLDDLSSLSLSEGLATIESNAFSDCINLTNIEIPDSVAGIGGSAFQGCTSLQSITLPNTLSRIEDGLFQECTSLTSINIPSVVTYIGFSAFQESGLTSVIIPNSVTEIDNSAFSDCTSLTSVSLPENIAIINNNLFRGCSSLSEIIIPDNVRTIRDYAFRYCSNLTNVQLPQNLERLDRQSFSDCTSLQQIEIPETVNTIGYAVFSNTAINEFLVSWTTPYEPNENIFVTTDISNATLRVPANTKNLYENIIPWKDFGTITEGQNVGENYTAIPDTNFEQHLIDEGIDTENILDGKILTLDISSLTSLNVSNKNISDLTGIQDFTALTSLNASENSIASIDLSNNNQLLTLNISQNQLTTISLLNNITLKNLNVEDNELAVLELDSNVNLQELIVSRNQLTALDVSNNIALTSLVCEQNIITNLDLSENNFLTKLLCNDNELTELNVKNGNNTQITNENFSAFSNPNLSCIKVDDVNYSNTTWSQIDMQTSFSNRCSTLVVIPDANFEAYLESINVGNGVVGDTFVNGDSLESLTSLNIESNNINDITGIEYFINLTSLNITDNNISQIDLSYNVLLETFIADFNQLTSLSLSENIKLKTVEVRNNTLSSVDITTLTGLEILELEANNLIELSLDTNLKLVALDVKNNNIASLDLSNQPQLVTLEANNNSLQSLNLKSTENPIVSVLNTTGNVNLTCIEVLNLSYYSSINVSKDVQTNFYETCPSTTAIPDLNFETYLESINLGNGVVGDGLVLTDLIESVTVLNIEAKNISDVTGLNDFKNLINFNARNNNISNIDLSNNAQLEIINLENNELLSIDFSKNFKLKNINIGDNQISKVDVYFLTELESLQCYKNQITSINLISNKKLKAFVANENQLQIVDVRENDKLVWLDVDDNNLVSLTVKNGANSIITNFSATGNSNLTCIEVDNVSYSETNWTAKDTTANFSGDCAPANDDCSFAIPLVFNQETPGDVNNGNFTNATDCVAGTIIADVWFSITVPETGEFSIEGSGFGGLLKFAVYETCSSQSAISCGLNISLTNLTPGDTYYLKVWMESTTSNKSLNSENGTFTLEASESSVLSVDENASIKNRLMLFPNPASNEITLKNLGQGTINSVEIYTLLGKRVFAKNGNFLSDLSINTSQLNTGVYLVKTNIEHKIITKKLVIN